MNYDEKLWQKVATIKQKISILKLHFDKMGIIRLLQYLIQRICVKKNCLMKINLLGYRYPIFLRNVNSDIQIFTQIFLRDELKIDLSNTPQNIIDGGANIGLASVYLKNRYPSSIIVAVEPDPTNFKMLLKNTAFYKNIFCHNCGIWNKNTSLKIINKNAGNESFIVAEVSCNEIIDGFINAITINEIIKSNNLIKIHLLKLDIEGSERNVFESNFSEWLSITDNILVEIHNWIDSKAEETVMAAINDSYNLNMSGEYHFFTKK